jgi:hypothetical protein
MFIDENKGFGHLAFFNGTAKEAGFYRRVVNLLFRNADLITVRFVA